MFSLHAYKLLRVIHLSPLLSRSLRLSVVINVSVRFSSGKRFTLYFATFLSSLSLPKCECCRPASFRNCGTVLWLDEHTASTTIFQFRNSSTPRFCSNVVGCHSYGVILHFDAYLWQKRFFFFTLKLQQEYRENPRRIPVVR